VKPWARRSLIIGMATYPAWYGVYWAVPLTAAAASTAVGVWHLINLITEPRRAENGVPWPPRTRP
jgi:hypothetical protein